MTRQQRGFTFVHPPGLSLACGSRMAREPLGFFPRLRTPQLPATHAREGTDHRARAWDHVIGIADLLTIHLQHATSCRTTEFVPFLQFDKEIRTVVCTTDEIVNSGAAAEGLFCTPCDWVHTVHGGSLIESGLTRVCACRARLPSRAMPQHPNGHGSSVLNVCASYSPSVPLLPT
jgi:hypothetical protein